MTHRLAKRPPRYRARLVACAGVFLCGGMLQGGPLLTRWATQVSATNALVEYPRPQQVRESWQNLNGLWDYAVTSADGTPETYSGQILVPYPIESHLSGLARPLQEHETLWYRRQFEVAENWKGQLLLLHFGAVDWSARVLVNGQCVGTHEGGYDGFSFDITRYVKWDSENELVVVVQDPTEGDQPRGKQSCKPEGIFYTASSGIWQTVWLEPVPKVHLTGLRLVPELKSPILGTAVSAKPPYQTGTAVSGPSRTDQPPCQVKVMAMANSMADDLRVEVAASFAGRPAGRISGTPGTEIILPLAIFRPWTPARPDLYDLEITLRRGPDVLDKVVSYFGLRDIRVVPDASGVPRILLNGQTLFQVGVLDQGFWPDGLYTAPTDDALRFDIETAKQLGFNLIRKHVKVEPARWYYWADKLGMLVWQDIPSGNNATEGGRRQFELELYRLIDQLANHPSIIAWVLFNEGWGQFDTERLARRINTTDPTRLLDSASGWTDFKMGDVIDLHSYPDPVAPAIEASRAGVLGEFGGLGLVVTNHTWSERKPWGYQLMSNPEQLMQQYHALLDKAWGLQKSNGLAAAVYTQLTDVETECNGFLTYDREILKLDPLDVRSANLHPPRLLPNAQDGPYEWSYTTSTPDADWMQPSFDCSSWKKGHGGFGTPKSPDVILKTAWESSEIWLRREFELPEGFAAPSALVMYHDEDAEVYINGVPALRTSGYVVRYKSFPIAPEAIRALRSGRNVLAIHCRQTTGGQYIDAGIEAEPGH